MKIPVYEIASVLEDVKTRMISEDQEKLDWCISQLLSNLSEPVIPPQLLLKSPSLTKEAVSQIEQHSNLLLIRQAKNDEEASKQLINNRMVKYTPLNIKQEINLPICNIDINDFYLDIFELAQEFGGVMIMCMYAQKIFAYWDLFLKMGIDLQDFLRYSKYIGEGYKPNIYHNVLHGAFVMQACHIFLLSSNLVELAEMTPLHTTSLLLSAMVHDYKHPGLNNTYLYLTNEKLAIRYNDISILENYHVAKAFQVAQKENLNIFSNISKEEYRTLRKLMINAILGTDMTKHSKYVTDAQMKLTKNTNFIEEKEFLISLLMHLGDLSNSCRNEKLSDEWSFRVCEEFFIQGDKERSNDMIVNPLMDRYKVNIAKSQVGFIGAVLIPFLNPICKSIKGMEFLLENAQSNKEGWGRRVEEFEDKMVNKGNIYERGFS
ncbi:hypothetical protein SteCoe_20540 [Stentor coeruleus]|uniref:Phosphodiesterase n=1 Tax=Stentor coeruleus TaxID=5963 RepID=A0A1R2BRL0_9CILI|nr:hypothetical protein SteCoe_20540 [Stentor coeruleus]